MAYRIEFSPEAVDHLALLTARQRATIVDGIEVQLLHQPGVPTRNRKPMRLDGRPPIAPWELRIGDARVYYEVETHPEAVVRIRAVGIKDRGRVTIGGEAIEP